MSRSALIKIGCALALVALLIGVVPAVATLLRSNESDGIDTTQQASDVGGALSFLFMCLPILFIGIGMIIAGIRSKSEDDA